MYNYIKIMNAIFEAYSIIKKRLASGGWNEGARLPTLGALAELYGVSRTTMWRAIGRLQKENLVHVKQGGGILAGPAGVITPHANTDGRQGALWERLKGALGRIFSPALLVTPCFL